MWTAAVRQPSAIGATKIGSLFHSEVRLYLVVDDNTRGVFIRAGGGKHRVASPVVVPGHHIIHSGGWTVDVSVEPEIEFIFQQKFHAMNGKVLGTNRWSTPS